MKEKHIIHEYRKAIFAVDKAQGRKGECYGDGGKI